MKNISILKMLDYPFSPEKWFREEYKCFRFTGTKNEMTRLSLSQRKAIEKVMPLSEMADNQIMDVRLFL